MNDIFDTEFEGKDIELDDNKAVIGDDINLMEKDPTLTRVLVGAGWDLNAFDADVLDLDVSVFMLDRNGLTRMDEDFVFYNQVQDLDGGVRHNGDSRTGVGDGDDESITVDLRAVSYDIHQLLFVLTVYKGIEKKQDIGSVRNAYLRITNADTANELVRYELDDDIKGKTETGMIVAALNREGPKWHFKPIGEFVEGGLAAFVERYGLILGAV